MNDTLVVGAYRIQDRWPKWARWRTVTPRPHSERFPFDSKGLAFRTLVEAREACAIFASTNCGEFRIVLPCGCLESERDICTHGGNGALA